MYDSWWFITHKPAESLLDFLIWPMLAWGLLLFIGICMYMAVGEKYVGWYMTHVEVKQIKKGIFMKRTLIVIALIVAIPVIFAFAAFSQYQSAYDYCNALEQSIKAQYRDNENVLAQYSNKIAESVQVPGMQRDDITKVFKEALSARYGADGSKAAMQWIQEQNPNLDTSVYKNIQAMIEAGRNEFGAGQTKLLDLKRNYETYTGSFFGGFWSRMAGFPKIDMSKYDIVSNDHASDSFKTKIEKPLQLQAK